MKKCIILPSLVISAAMIALMGGPAHAHEPQIMEATTEVTTLEFKEQFISDNSQTYTAPSMIVENATEAEIATVSSNTSAPTVDLSARDHYTVTVRPEVVRPTPKIISDDFGMRMHPILGYSRMHNGVDYAPGSGTPILAVADGVVESVVKSDNGGYGVHVIVKHETLGVSSLSGHMLIGSTAVEVGQEVKAGDKIGEVGSTGLSTGPHLHFEILKDFKTPIDPEKWFAEHKVS